MDILLVSPPVTLEERLTERRKAVRHAFPPMGPLHLAAVARQRGYRIAILDAVALGLTIKETVERILQASPRYLGFYSVTMNIHRVADIALQVKVQVPQVTVLLGGPHITALPRETMELFPQIDMGVYGEGERTLMELLEALDRRASVEDLARIPGLVLRRDGRAFLTPRRPYISHLEELPLPAWDLLPSVAESYTPSPHNYSRLPATSMSTSRGCPFQCIYCDRAMWGRKWRGFSPQYVVSHMKHLHQTYGIKDINIRDDHFMVNKKWLREVCDLLKEEKLDLVWSTWGRADAATPEVLRWMREAGCWQITYGMESGCQEILDFMKRHMSVEDMERGVRMTKEAGMSIKGLFIAGCPLETKDTLARTVDFIHRLPFDFFSFSHFTPLPNTEIYPVAHQYGSFQDDWRQMSLMHPVFVPHGLDREYLEEFVKAMNEEGQGKGSPPGVEPSTLETWGRG
ncbi:MAG: radical SAM protein [Chloroflexi bacterium]|nr:radical SAM protein [Chloroflexota bacterium]